MQNARMCFLWAIWRLRRWIVPIVALVMLTVTVDRHPSFSDDTSISFFATSDIHSDNGDVGARHSHNASHHDHHAEFAAVAEMDFSGSPLIHEIGRYPSWSRQIVLALDRPPNLSDADALGA